MIKRKWCEWGTCNTHEKDKKIHNKIYYVKHFDIPRHRCILQILTSGKTLKNFSWLLRSARRY